MIRPEKDNFVKSWWVNDHEFKDKTSVDRDTVAFNIPVYDIDFIEDIIKVNKDNNDSIYLFRLMILMLLRYNKRW